MVAIRNTMARPDISIRRRGRSILISNAATAGTTMHGADPQADVARQHAARIQMQAKIL